METANAPPVLPETPSDSAAGLPAPAPPAPSLPPLWASLLALGVVVLAVGLPLGWLLPDGSTYPLGVTTRVLGGLLVVWALIQVAHPERVSIRARRALLVSAFLLAAALAALLLGSGPTAPRPADGAPGPPEGIALVVPLALAGLLGAAWGGTRGIRSLARRSAWSFACRDWERAAWLTPAALAASTLATATLCVLGLALEAPLDPTSFPIFTIAASLLHGAAAAAIAQALASSLRDQAQLRAEPLPVLARLAPRGRVGLIALALVLAPTLALEAGRVLYHLQAPTYSRVIRTADTWQPPPPPPGGEPFRGSIGAVGVVARPGPGERLDPSDSTQVVAWRLSLTRDGERLLRVEHEVAVTVKLNSGVVSGAQSYTRRALGAQDYHLCVESWLQATPTEGRIRYTTWVALSSGASEPRLAGAFLATPWEGSQAMLLATSPRRLRLAGYEALLPVVPSAPRAEAGLRWVLRLDGGFAIPKQLGAPPPAPGVVRIEAAADDHSYHLVSEQELVTEDATGARASSDRTTRVRRIPWRGGVW